ncbi:Uncharacterised protein [Raoultella planticola]|uniref:Uncharacterized protein n=1 Tax=Raoultella planticola TaxID=575 RepID=A0A485CTK6_RAOPL|nr:Uncharacterised protein [Raoultella planticola]
MAWKFTVLTPILSSSSIPRILTNAMISGAAAATTVRVSRWPVLDITHKMASQYADDAFIIGYRFLPEELEEPGIPF